MHERALTFVFIYLTLNKQQNIPEIIPFCLRFSISKQVPLIKVSSVRKVGHFTLKIEKYSENCS